MNFGIRILILALFAAFNSEASGTRAHFWDKLVSGRDYLTDEIVIKVKPGVTSSQIVHLGTSLGCVLVKKLGRLPFYQFTIPAGTTPTDLAEIFESNQALVDSAEPNGLLKPCYVPSVFPNDPFYQDGGTMGNIVNTQLIKLGILRREE